MARSRQQWLDDERGTYTGYMTSGELCKYLNINPRTLRRWQTGGLRPAATTPAGWGLWSPDQQRELLRKIARLD